MYNTYIMITTRSVTISYFTIYMSYLARLASESSGGQLGEHGTRTRHGHRDVITTHLQCQTVEPRLNNHNYFHFPPTNTEICMN